MNRYKFPSVLHACVQRRRWANLENSTVTAHSHSFPSVAVSECWNHCAGVARRDLPVTIDAPNTSHEDSDDCGAIILGDEEKRPNYDNKGARLNLIRTRTLIDDADVVVVRFGDKYRQWNAAFDAGYATARGKALVTLHPPGVSHMLKEVNATALAVCEDASQVVDVLDYVITGALPEPRDGPGFKTMMERQGAGNPNPGG